MNKFIESNPISFYNNQSTTTKLANCLFLKTKQSRYAINKITACIQVHVYISFYGRMNASTKHSFTSFSQPLSSVTIRSMKCLEFTLHDNSILTKLFQRKDDHSVTFGHMVYMFSTLEKSYRVTMIGAHCE